MNITYIDHSGFLVETKDCYYIFDYYQGKLPVLDRHKPAIVFSSHFHQDHYNPEIFSILQSMGITCQAVLANDISKRKYPEGIRVTTVQHDKTYQLDNGTTVSTLLSTDSGVAFVVTTAEGTIYHAGDLNDWYWEGEPEADNRRMTGMYRAAIDKIRGMHFDVAFVPLDPRQEGHYADGMLYFLQQADCGAVFPMHYWGQPQVIERFLAEHPQHQPRIRHTNTAKGETV
ncbi:MAG: MBL fold metallo-hydrolase [Clostridia bacterium]|nr:MBL fold metallo-hydrolase [Clostridia bacterium]